jgi:hypothetical protein
MSTINQSLPAILRRRATVLHDDDYTPEFVGALLRAADELQVRQAMQISEDEAVAVQAVAEVRILRACLGRVYSQVRAQKPHGWPQEVLTRIKNTLRDVPETGKGRVILAIQIGDGETPQQVIQHAVKAIAQYFHQKGQTNGDTQLRIENAEPRRDDRPGDEASEGHAASSSEGAEGPHAVEGGAGRDVDQHPGNPEGDGGTPGAGVTPGGQGPRAVADRSAAPQAEAQPLTAPLRSIDDRFVIKPKKATPDMGGPRPPEPEAALMRHALMAGEERADLTERLSRQCDHKFVDSKTCLKCGWAPDAQA